jgi:hypothetical protein
LFAQPVTIKKFTGLINFKKTTLLKERLASYQANVSKPIQKWCKNFVENYDNLHESCSSVLNLTRIFFFNDQKLTKKVKKNNKIADKLLGLPIISKKIKYCIPRNGYKVFFTNFEKILKKKIKIKFNSKIRIERGLNKNVKLYENSKLFISDKIIWAGNPIPLMHSLGYRNFTNSLLKIKVYFANIKFTKKYNAQNFYIQVFSKKTNIFRIYIYKFRGQFKITIETFLKNEFINFNKEYLLKILGKFKIYIKILDPLIEHDEIRNILITKSDYYKFLKFEKEYSNSNIIGGGWHLFGTEKKINYIMSKFLD